MTELPQGTVTLVFTDIEGSTRLLTSLGSRYEAVLADHRKLLRAAFKHARPKRVAAEANAAQIRPHEQPRLVNWNELPPQLPISIIALDWPRANRIEME